MDSELIGQIALLVIPALTGLLGYFWGKAQELVKASPNKIDDAILKAVQDVVGGQAPKQDV